MLAFDCSNWTGEITLEQAFSARKTYPKAVVQIIDPPSAYPASAWRQQVGVLSAVGFDIEAYTYLYLRSNPEERVAWVLSQVGMLPGVRRVWLDVEDEGDVAISLADRQYALWRCIQLVREAGYEVGIYTGKWWWDIYMQGVKWPSWYAQLWVAQYDGVQDLSFVPFGGWTQAYMKQYAGTSVIETEYGNITNVDLNVA